MTNGRPSGTWVRSRSHRSRDAYLVSMRLSSPPPDAEWLRLFNHPTGLELTYLVRKATVTGEVVEIVVQNTEQMHASVDYTEQAIAQANNAYNDDVLPRRARHQRLRDAARGKDLDGLDEMARAAKAL